MAFAAARPAGSAAARPGSAASRVLGARRAPPGGRPASPPPPRLVCSKDALQKRIHSAWFEVDKALIDAALAENKHARRRSHVLAQYYASQQEGPKGRNRRAALIADEKPLTKAGMLDEALKILDRNLVSLATDGPHEQAESDMINFSGFYTEVNGRPNP